jgi:hypothetical protein
MMELGIADIRDVGMPSISRFLGITIWRKSEDSVFGLASLTVLSVRST